jgi:hypothetical protein
MTSRFISVILARNLTRGSATSPAGPSRPVPDVVLRVRQRDPVQRQLRRDGVVVGTRGMVKELVEAYATHLGRWPELIVTGGDAEQLFAGWELVHAVSPELTLYGIALAYTGHHIRHGT